MSLDKASEQENKELRKKILALTMAKNPSTCPPTTEIPAQAYCNELESD